MIPVPHPFKVELDDETAKALGDAANDLKAKKGNYRIGVGNVAASLLSFLSRNPNLLRKYLAEMEGGEVEEEAAPPKKAAGGKRKAA